MSYLLRNLVEFFPFAGGLALNEAVDDDVELGDEVFAVLGIVVQVSDDEEIEDEVAVSLALNRFTDDDEEIGDEAFGLVGLNAVIDDDEEITDEAFGVVQLFVSQPGGTYVILLRRRKR
jgi:hypothetical protein